MDEQPVSVEEIVEKAESYLHETSLTPEEYEALKRSVGELAPVFSAWEATASRRSSASNSSRTDSTGDPARTPS